MKGTHMYLARDKNGELYLFNEIPRRGTDCWWAEKEVDGTYLKLDSGLYPHISWETEPVFVSIPVTAVAG